MVFCVTTGEERAAKIQKKYNELGTDIPLLWLYKADFLIVC
jgi:hypothetical protein